MRSFEFLRSVTVACALGASAPALLIAGFGLTGAAMRRSRFVGA
jgi:hypothetical protein